MTTNRGDPTADLREQCGERAESDVVEHDRERRD